MTYTVDEPLSQFHFWSGAKSTAETLTIEQLDQLDEMLPEFLGENPSDTEINDLFWFNPDIIASSLGFADWEELEACNMAEDESQIPNMSAKQLATAIRRKATWDNDLNAALCAKAGMSDEWNAADGDTFESVLEAAADKLGVEIY